MADKRCFVQFPHPGKEHLPNTGREWHRQCRYHKRKFMQLRGEWIEESGAKQLGDLWAWGEWEPESDIVRAFNPAPFIFGKHFLYSNCRSAGWNRLP